MNLNITQLKRHIIFWIIIITYLNLDSPVPGSWAAKIIGGVLESLNYIFVFYRFSLFIFPLFWEKRCIFLLLTFIIVSYCLYSTVAYFNYLKIIPYLGGFSFHQKY